MDKLIDYLGGENFLKRKLKAANFTEGLVFPKEKSELSFSYCLDNKNTNFIIFRHCKKTRYKIELYKVTLFKHELISLIENVPLSDIDYVFEKMLNIDLY